MPSLSNLEPDEEERTLQEWNELGYYVIKGEVSTGRNKKGVATFKASQVEEREEDFYESIGWIDELH